MVEGSVFGRTLRLEGSPFTHLVYQREFGDSLQGAWAALSTGLIPEELAAPVLFQIIWAMCKTYDDRNTQLFHRWMCEFGFDETDETITIPDADELLNEAFELARDVVRAELAPSDRPNHQEAPTDGDAGDDEEPDDMARWIAWQNILSVMQFGFSYEDVKHMPMCDFVTYTDLLSAPIEEAETSSRKATQADWDWLMS